MTSFTPYTYFQCPCTENSTSSRTFGEDLPSPTSDTSEDDRTFDPRAPRAAYSLHPLEHLLYCEDCHQIRCHRCVLDEIVTWYCPNCLFEVPSSSVKSEGNRCTRSCFQCPVCTASLSVSSVALAQTGLGADISAQAGPYVLNCTYCQWSSKEIGIQLEKPNGIYAQLSKVKNGGEPYISAKDRRREDRRDISESPKGPGPNETLDADSQFENLKSFYQSQLADSAPSGGMGFMGGYGYGSPGALSRIMGLYTGSSFGDKKRESKNGNMREVCDSSEGLQLTSTKDDQCAITRIQRVGWEGTASTAQQKEQAQSVRFMDDLRPFSHLLRTKRSKRCRACRHILSKPESKVQNTRFRIRLVARNYIPAITIQPLQQAPTSLLTPMKPVQFVLTVKNPLFESVRVNIATPASTPGRFASKVTVLCPQFEIGASTDMFDEALREGGKEKRRTKAEASEGQLQAEAGKIWERGRNWVSVVVEIVPASLRTDGPEFMKSQQIQKDDGPLREDEDVLEIPVFVRVEWETDAAHEESGGLAAGNKEKELKEKRELAYWCVIGVGRIAQD
ncbi:dynactin-like protein Arp1 p62 subunit RO2 [Calycina marina]|uniref:Dynactin subunit 4 n=1 Tax=Calycina marina TaxID=1763456 RepID=A0A9P8CID6_9HELO|nr:dynactin-like protein Arp1 p62 subunit RO2 [Calycina marina]